MLVEKRMKNGLRAVGTKLNAMQERSQYIAHFQLLTDPAGIRIE
jgi:hypothetical protein